MFQFRDFIPTTDSSGQARVGSAVAEANAWAQENQARVLSIETLLLPGAPTDLAVQVDGAIHSRSHHFQVLRLWYELPEVGDYRR